MSVCSDPMEKADIIREIVRTAAENGGAPLGQKRFEQETGIGVSRWRGKHWARWSEAIAEAGFAPNERSAAHELQDLARHLANLTRRLGRLPTDAEVLLERRSNPSFPHRYSFRRHLGGCEAWADHLRDLARSDAAWADLAALLPATPKEASADGSKTSGEADGAVYMLRLGKHYKIGKSYSVPRRHREIAIELPEKPDVVHVITTDDPSGIEAYWHRRFAEKRTNGEWFSLTREDVAAFRRRRFM